MFSICFLQPSNPLKILTLSLSGAITSSHFLIHRLVAGRELAMADMPPLVLSVALFFSSSSSISHIIILFREGLKKPLYFKAKCSLNVVVQIFAQCGCSKFLPMNVFKCSRIVGVQMFTHCGYSNVCPILVFKYSTNVGVQIFNQCVCSNIHPMWVIKYSPNVVVQMFTQCGCSSDCPM